MGDVTTKTQLHPHFPHPHFPHQEIDANRHVGFVSRNYTKVVVNSPICFNEKMTYTHHIPVITQKPFDLITILFSMEIKNATHAQKGMSCVFSANIRYDIILLFSPLPFFDTANRKKTENIKRFLHFSITTLGLMSLKGSFSENHSRERRVRNEFLFTDRYVRSRE